MCVDFRELNAHIVKDRFLFPRINNNQLDRLGRGKFFTRPLIWRRGSTRIHIDSQNRIRHPQQSL
jgi:hypothetical protein